MDDKLNIAQTSDFLGVSNATIRNWIRHKYLSPLDGSKNIVFDYNEVKLLKENILEGSIERLNRRANKRNSIKKFVPKEYVGEDTFNTDLINVTEYIIRNSLEIHQSVFLLSLNLLIKEQFVFNKDIKELLVFKDSDYKNYFLLNILKEFYNQI